MAIVMNLKWAGVTRDQYDRTRKAVRWEEDTPQGALFHVASFGDDAIYVVDVWESEDDWNRFLTERLQPGVQEAGIQGEPEVETREAYRIFAPGYQ